MLGVYCEQRITVQFKIMSTNHRVVEHSWHPCARSLTIISTFQSSYNFRSTGEKVSVSKKVTVWGLLNRNHELNCDTSSGNTGYVLRISRPKLLTASFTTWNAPSSTVLAGNLYEWWEFRKWSEVEARENRVESQTLTSTISLTSLRCEGSILRLESAATMLSTWCASRKASQERSIDAHVVWYPTRRVPSFSYRKVKSNTNFKHSMGLTWSHSAKQIVLFNLNVSDVHTKKRGFMSPGHLQADPWQSCTQTACLICGKQFNVNMGVAETWCRA